MSQAIYHEARGESYKGKIAIGHVILNRIERGYGSDPCEIISQKNQFSWYRMNYKVRELNRWKECIELSKLIISGKTKDPTKGSIFFHEKHINPGWRYTKTTLIGSHMFYK